MENLFKDTFYPSERPMKIAYLISPDEYASPATNTSLHLLMGSFRTGDDVSVLYPQDIYFQDGVLKGILRRPKIGTPDDVEDLAHHMRSALEDAHRIRERSLKRRNRHERISTDSLADLDVLVYRLNPPSVAEVGGHPSVRQMVFFAKEAERNRTLQYLSLLRGHVALINDPVGIFLGADKSYVLGFPEVAPKTYLSKEVDRLIGIISEVGPQAIVKPTSGYGGESVIRVTKDQLGDKGTLELLRSRLEALTDGEQRVVMVQEYLEDVQVQGDKRILVLGGEPIGAYARVPPDGSHLANLHAGGEAAPAEVTEKDREIVTHIASKLLADGLYFVGVDVIGGKLTEINVQSPGGVPRINNFTGGQLEDVVATNFQKLVSQKKPVKKKR